MVLPLAFEWRNVLFANWAVPEEIVAARLPDWLSVDTYDGNGWLSIVPFSNVDTRPRRLPAELGMTLPELNLRTYVTCDGEPGVYFFSLDTESLLAVLGARLTHRLPYYYARMNMQADGRQVAFTSRRRHPGAQPAQFEATYRPTGQSVEAEPDSRAEFLTERRRLYTQAQDGTIRYTDVHHERWPLYSAELSISENTLFKANRFDPPDGDPVLYYSPGVDVVTARSKRW